MTVNSKQRAFEYCNECLSFVQTPSCDGEMLCREYENLCRWVCGICSVQGRRTNAPEPCRTCKSAWSKKEHQYTGALMAYCEKYDMEIEKVKECELLNEVSECQAK